MATPPSRYLFGFIPMYSALIVLGIVLAILIVRRESLRKGLAPDTAVDLALYAVPFGIIGARLYYVIFRWESYCASPVTVLYLWEGGLAIYGAVIGGALGMLLCCHRRKLSYPIAADIVAPGLILAQAIGRWGNYFNQEAYGPLVSLPALQHFPLCVNIGGEWYMATFFYESLWNLSCFAALMILRTKIRKNGDLFLFYMVFYGSGRFVIEQLRQDSLYLGSLRASQWLSLLLCLTAVLLIMRDATPARRWWSHAGISLLLSAQWVIPGQMLLCALMTIIALVWTILELEPKKNGKAWLNGLLFLPNLAANVIGCFFPLPDTNFTLLVTGMLRALSFCSVQIALYCHMGVSL